MISAILIFIAIFCVFLLVLQNFEKKKKNTKVVIFMLATWFMLGGFLLNSAFIGQGISEIAETDKYVDLGDGYGVHQTEDGKYYQIKNKWWTFWDMYEKEYITEEQVEYIRENHNKITIR